MSKKTDDYDLCANLLKEIKESEKVNENLYQDLVKLSIVDLKKGNVDDNLIRIINEEVKDRLEDGDPSNDGDYKKYSIHNENKSLLEFSLRLNCHETTKHILDKFNIDTYIEFAIKRYDLYKYDLKNYQDKKEHATEDENITRLEDLKEPTKPTSVLNSLLLTMIKYPNYLLDNEEHLEHLTKIFHRGGGLKTKMEDNEYKDILDINVQDYNGDSLLMLIIKKYVQVDDPKLRGKYINLINILKQYRINPFIRNNDDNNQNVDDISKYNIYDKIEYMLYLHKTAYIILFLRFVDIMEEKKQKWFKESKNENKRLKPRPDWFNEFEKPKRQRQRGGNYDEELLFGKQKEIIKLMDSLLKYEAEYASENEINLDETDISHRELAKMVDQIKTNSNFFEIFEKQLENPSVIKKILEHKKKQDDENRKNNKGSENMSNDPFSEDSVNDSVSEDSASGEDSEDSEDRENDSSGKNIVNEQHVKNNKNGSVNQNNKILDSSGYASWKKNNHNTNYKSVPELPNVQRGGGSTYYDKYQKYKVKYLNLKNKM
jgi:hypothetical protein